MSNHIDFNKTRYLELLKKNKTLQNRGIDIFKKNPEEANELYSYKIMLENQIYYNRRDEYICLINKYLKGKICFGLFLWEFFSLRRENLQAFDVIEKEILKQGISRLDTFCIDSKFVLIPSLY